jgi:hypothetical protein
MKKKKVIAKIENKEYVYWSNIKDKSKTEVEQLENMLKFNKAIILMCEQRMKKEKRGVRIFG